mmetsp:Transcript_49105/g.162571  ORF Transcript_49105/g.162571 Transcript_49105/m.162571 type:complete len:235 (-) Transcript_49105:4-708(-)
MSRNSDELGVGGRTSPSSPHSHLCSTTGSVSAAVARNASPRMRASEMSSESSGTDCVSTSLGGRAARLEKPRLVRAAARRLVDRRMAFGIPDAASHARSVELLDCVAGRTGAPSRRRTALRSSEHRLPASARARFAWTPPGAGWVSVGWTSGGRGGGRQVETKPRARTRAASQANSTPSPVSLASVTASSSDRCSGASMYTARTLRQRACAMATSADGASSPVLIHVCLSAAGR